MRRITTPAFPVEMAPATIVDADQWSNYRIITKREGGGKRLEALEAL